MRTILVATASLAVIAGCGASEAPSDDAGQASTTITDATTVRAALDDNVDIETGDTSEDTADAVDVKLAGDSATSDSDAVTAKDGTVTISAPGTYRLHGTLAGQVVVDSDADGAVRLLLDGATITSGTTAALHVAEADSVVVVLKGGTQNLLQDASTYEDTSDDAPTGALYSTADLTIGGTGSLTVEGQSNNGIVSKDGLVLAGGAISVDAVDDGIIGKDYLVASGADVNVTAVDDGLRSDNTEDPGSGFVLVQDGSVRVDSRDDAVKGVQVLVSGGSIDVAGSTEAVEGSVIIVDDGDLDLRSADDAINASSSDGDESTRQPGGSMAADDSLRVVINGGTVDVWASGDGIDSNGDLSITGGRVTVHGPTGGEDGALDANGAFEVSGGTLLATGSAAMMGVPSSDSPQGWLAADLDSTVAAGERVVIKDADGTEVAAFTARKDLESVVHSSAEVKAGATYTVTAGGNTTTVTAGEAPAGAHAPADS
ncbi:carbohydrate-binding domain-containing protein [Aeromicrobium duanguangcaii]|uniref:Carbohydrate-binding domain-containing protein n=1 Tax=Aeromicrobium duanguangcaii TaxID=2968086 RepID=A0ABY5KGF1_9ACTN|nr:carbohydrate-binding domain-containing protein [Aeromicrobium duanguangcaii]MCD9153348.1 carbohydrate-binding domain-containing protein [Aeromicrobium duanguangcaii]UUI69559.1 carbohydrate-binding domain-containing protein [Aeromicrobium duanguangcaii]